MNHCHDHLRVRASMTTLHTVCGLSKVYIQAPWLPIKGLPEEVIRMLAITCPFTVLMTEKPTDLFPVVYVGFVQQGG